MWRKGTGGFFRLIVLLAFAWLAGLFWFARVTEAMAPPATPEKLDAIVVLTGGSNRVAAGFRLLDESRGDKLFISGVHRGVEIAELMKLLREEGSRKAECCVALGGAENTVENAQETAAWLSKEGFKTFHLVTANYHMKRALLEFKAAAPDAEARPYPVSPQKVDMRAWWRDKASRRLIVREYTKYLAVLAQSLAGGKGWFHG